MKNRLLFFLIGVLFLGLNPTLNARTLEVEQFPPGGVHVRGDIYPTIQAAIDDASDGDTINIHTGTYDEALNIEDFNGLTLNGVEDRTTIIIQPSTTLPWNVGGYGTSRQAAIRVVNATGVVLQGMTFDYDLIKGNNIFGVFGWNSGVTIDDCILENMSVDDLSGGYYELTSYFRAPDFSPSARAQVNVTNCEFFNSGRVGVVTHDYIETSISGNTFYKTIDDFGYGVEVGSQSTGTVTNNVFYGYDIPAASDGSESAGIYIENAFTGSSPSLTKNVTVSNNEVYDCQYAMWIGNGYNGFAGDVDIIVNVSGNNFHNNVDGCSFSFKVAKI